VGGGHTALRPVSGPGVMLGAKRWRRCCRNSSPDHHPRAARLSFPHDRHFNWLRLNVEENHLTYYSRFPVKSFALQFYYSTWSILCACHTLMYAYSSGHRSLPR
jgi:hypothetical protein